MLTILSTTEVSYTPYKTTKNGGAVGSGLEGLNAVYLGKKERGQSVTEESAGHGVTLCTFEDTSNTAFLLRDGDSPIGFLTTWTRTKQTATSFVKPKYQGLGFGKKLYEAAIQHFGTLYSDNSLSEFSTVVWQSLSKKHTVKLVFKDKEIPIIGWEVGKGRMTYPVLNGSDLGLSQKRVSLGELLVKPPMPNISMDDTDAQRNALYDDFFAKSKLKAAAQDSRFVVHK